MNANRFNLPKTGLLLALSLGLADQAMASASYSSNIDVLYTITLTGGDNPTPGDTVGLALLGSFLQATDSSSFFANVSGDGVYHTHSPTAASTSVSSVYHGSFTASGSAGVGSVDSLNTALFGLNLNNAGPYSYNLTVQFDYSLTDRAQGEFANSSVLFDYWNEAGTIAGSDYLSSTSYTGWLDDPQATSGTASWQFVLASGASQQLYAQAGVLSHVESTVATVPVPASVWLFASAICSLSRFSRRAQLS